MSTRACPRHGLDFTSHELRCEVCGGFGLCLGCLRQNGYTLTEMPREGVLFCFSCASGSASRERHRRNRIAREAAERFA